MTQPTIPRVIVEDNVTNVIVTAPGPQGPAGTFSPGDVSYTHIQSVASNTWTVNHNLGFNPTAVVLDSAGTNCEGTFSYPTTNTLIITFTAAFTGTAYVI